MCFPIFVFARRSADMSAENVEHHSAPLFVFRVFYQMEEFVGSAYTHRVRFMPQVFNGIFQALLPLPLLGFRYSIGLRSRLKTLFFSFNPFE